MEITQEEQHRSFAIRFSARENQAEVGRAYLYVIYNNLHNLAEEIDKTLKDGVENSFNKIFYQFNKTKDRFINNLNERNKITHNHKKKIQDYLLPEGYLQERKLNVFSFISLYGMEFIQFLYNEIDIKRNKHQILYVE